MEEALDLLVTGIGRLVTAKGTSPKGGKGMGMLKSIPKAAIAARAGRVVAAGPEEEVLAAVGDRPVGRWLDAAGRLVTPGLIDAHTHLVHAGSREHELTLKLHGMSYLEILAAGGGIQRTVSDTRRASQADLYEKARRTLDVMMTMGTTTVEAKSGYGLEWETERKQLRVARELNRRHPMDVVSTFLGAHAVPGEYRDRPDDYVAQVAEEMVPAVAREKLAEFCDVFCEQGVFSAERSRVILEAGRRWGLRPKVHADELAATGGAELAAEVGAVSADHLLHATEEGLRALAQGDVVAVLLPGTAFFLGETPAPARKMIDEFALPVALATDYNPGSSPTESLQLIMAMAAAMMRMTPEEILTAVTLNAACAVGKGEETGTLEPGKWADFVLWEAENPEYLVYRFGMNHAHAVVKKGHLVAVEGRFVGRV
ncbi:imidazolonepropionase [Kyrpidia spormannii]|uniref:Imidazolone-5-propionate hydrolase n=1 Tax=Kyrpidia spormannii TaxID=2055160 RepID=A0ACA8Z6F6_9BACL|nr:imidazolonepropionase [Kyrpidia spormannii]CAB3389627.1 imidazolone-5-propionate hydrolase [Kyrpidia spormannii]